MTTTTATKTTPRKLLRIDPRKLKPSPFNLGGAADCARMKDLSDITSTAKEVGITCPLLARPVSKGGIPLPAFTEGDVLEVVYGHRRQGAAIEIGLKEIPVEVEVMDDARARLLQQVENLARADPHPLDEGVAWEALLKDGYEVPEIAAQFGKSKSYVWKRLALTKLIPKIARLYRQGKLRHWEALLIATVHPSLQNEAKRCTASCSSAERAKASLQRQVLNTLKDAPFDPKDAELVPAAGACRLCPKNTSCRMGLFEGMDKGLCVDLACWKSKVEAHWKKLKAEAKGKGDAVMSPADAKKNLGDWGLSHQAKSWVDLDKAEYVSGKYKKTETLLKGKRLPITYAKHGNKIYRLVAAKAFNKAVGRLSQKPKAKRRKDGLTPKQWEKKQKARNARVDLEVDKAIVAKVAIMKQDDWLRATLKALGAVLQVYELLHVAKVLDLDVSTEKPLADLLKLKGANLKRAVTATVDQRGLYWDKYTPSRGSVKIGEKAIEKRVDAAIAKENAATKKAKAKGGAK